MGDPTLFELSQIPDAKRCRKCDEEKPLDEFPAEKRNRDGRAGSCRDCERKRNEARYERDRDKFIARALARYAANPDAVKKRAREWRKNNRDRENAGARARYAANPGHFRALGRAWYRSGLERNRALARNKSNKRYAVTKAAFFENVDVQVVWESFDGICHLCGLPADPDGWHVEHVVPIACGGSHSYQNCAVSHPSCNQSKNAGYAPSALGLLGAYTITPVCCL